MPSKQVITPTSPSNSFKLDQDRKRAADRRHKYALGAYSNGSRTQPTTMRQIRRQVLDGGLKAVTPLHPLGKPGKRPARWTADGDDPTSSDSSAPEDDLGGPSAAPEPDADIAYSFDAPGGPTRGADVLSVAVNRAVERFENKATEKLIHDEYDVVDAKDNDQAGACYSTDDEFELV